MMVKLVAVLIIDLILSLLLWTSSADAQELPSRSTLGAGNTAATRIAKQSPLVQSSFQLLVQQVQRVRDNRLRTQTLDAIRNQKTCVRHRVGVTPQKQQEILSNLAKAGLIQVTDRSQSSGSTASSLSSNEMIAGVFPPLLNDGSSCPQLPQPFFAAPGSAFGSHHSQPGGLPIHEALNHLSGLGLLHSYQQVYGTLNSNALPIVGSSHQGQTDLPINEDILIAAPIWHDWAKSIVFQWNADGTEFKELEFGGNGATDNYGAAGDSRTGAHHILSLAEAIKRGLPPEFIITQASAHAAPSLGNEYKVVNWLNAAAILAQVDPLAQGYLVRDRQGRLRLPPVRQLGKIDLNAANQPNLLAEYAFHNLSDADYVLSIPAVALSQVLLSTVAPQFGYDSRDISAYNNKFRNPVLSYLSAERLLIIYSNRGLNGVVNEIRKLRSRGVI